MSAPGGSGLGGVCSQGSGQGCLLLGGVWSGGCLPLGGLVWGVSSPRGLVRGVVLPGGVWSGGCLLPEVWSGGCLLLGVVCSWMVSALVGLVRGVYPSMHCGRHPTTPHCGKNS